MSKIKEELVPSSKSYCKVGKITYRKYTADYSGSIQYDFKPEALNKLNIRFTEKPNIQSESFSRSQ